MPYVAPDQVVDYLAGADAGLVPLRHRPNHEISLVTKYMEYAQARLPLVVSDVRVMAAFTRRARVRRGLRGGCGGGPRHALARRRAGGARDPGRYAAACEAAADVLAGLTWEEQAGVLAGPLRAGSAHLPQPDTPAV